MDVKPICKECQSEQFNLIDLRQVFRRYEKFDEDGIKQYYLVSNVVVVLKCCDCGMHTRVTIKHLNPNQELTGLDWHVSEK